MMARGGNLTVLVAGLVLVALGSLLLAVNLGGLQVDWWWLLKFLLPILFLWMGVYKLLRHFLWSEEDLNRYPRRTSLLGGVFWTFLGAVLVLDLSGVLESLPFIGRYWPLILILFGLGKLVDFYRLSGRLQIRTGEVFGLIFIITFGLASNRLALAHWPLLSFDRWHWPISIGSAEPRHRFGSQQQVSLDGVTEVEVENAYGDVRIEAGGGTEGEIELAKVVRQESVEEARQLADRVGIKVGEQDGILRIGTNREALGQLGSRFVTDLVLRMPEELPVRVVNRYGDIRLADRKAPSSLENYYGEISVVNLEADLTITSSYDLVEVEAVKGTVKVENQRGEIKLERVEGNIEASTTHNSLLARDVRGDVVARNQNGSLRLETITGTARVEAPGSRVFVSDVEGEVFVQNSHKAVTLRDLASQLELETAYSEVRLARVAGAVKLNAVHSTINGERLDSEVEILGRGSAVSLSAVGGDARVETSLRRVRINDFRGALTVQNEFGDIDLVAGDSLGGPMSVSNQNGEISLALPAGASFQLSARTKGGLIDSDFGQVSSGPPEEVPFLETVVGSGGPLVELQTTFKQIRVKSVKKGG